MPQPKPLHDAAKSAVLPVTMKEYLALATFIQGKDRVYKKDPHAEAVRSAAELYGHREYVASYECLKPAYDKVVADMQRVLARNVEFEANKLAKLQHKPIATAKENVLAMRAHAQQVMDQFNRLLGDLESKPLVRHHIKKGGVQTPAAAPPVEEPPPTTLGSTSETRIDAPHEPLEVKIGGRRFQKSAYAPPAIGALYSVRDKLKLERVIRVIGKSEDGATIQVEILEEGQPTTQPIQLAVESLARQSVKGWCSVLVPVEDAEDAPSATSAGSGDAPDAPSIGIMRIDIQNFGRCCADIARAKLKFSTQLVKDIGDGPFRAGKYEQAFLAFEQLGVGFNAAVAAGRREIEDGRRRLTAEKNNLSGKEIQDRSAAFIRHEQQIHTVEREFSTILEGLRMYLRASQGNSSPGA